MRYGSADSDGEETRLLRAYMVSPISILLLLVHGFRERFTVDFSTDKPSSVLQYRRRRSLFSNDNSAFVRPRRRIDSNSLGESSREESTRATLCISRTDRMNNR